jgi:hypothetical protein
MNARMVRALALAGAALVSGCGGTGPNQGGGPFRGTLAFFQDTDTVAIAGDMDLGTDCTFEVWVSIASLTEFGRFWGEWEAAASDKYLGVAPGEIRAYVFPSSPTNPFPGPVGISLNEWHHVAYVKQGTEERLYMDGDLVASRSCGASIGNAASAAMWLGAFFRDGSIHKSFIGQMKSVRISSFARYVGAHYSEPSPDMISDPGTELHYTFSDPVIGGTVFDRSGNGHTGTLGAGFAGATAPVVLR